jgi:hypothetical protein
LKILLRKNDFFKKSNLVYILIKTLIGKNGYLFLTNDTAKEIESHFCNETTVKNYACIKKENYLLTVFPNKSYLLRHLLPDTYLLRYRPAFNKYAEVLGDHILDGYEILKDLNVFYKTDTHLNLYGACEMYYHFVDRVNELFNLNIIKKEISIKNKECILSTLKKGLGDLTWVENKGDQIIDDLMDTYFFSEEVPQVLLECTIEVHSSLRILDNDLNDVNDVLQGKLINWDFLLLIVNLC